MPYRGRYAHVRRRLMNHYRRVKKTRNRGRRRTRRSFLNKSKRAKSFITKFNRRQFKISQLPRPFGSPNYEFHLIQDTVNFSFTKASMTSSLNAQYSPAISWFFTTTKLSYLNTTFAYWYPMWTKISIRLASMDYLNEQVTTQYTVPATVAGDQPSYTATSNNNIPISTKGYGIDFFVAQSLSPATTTYQATFTSALANLRQAICSSPKFRRLLIGRKPVTFNWNNPIGTRGLFSAIPLTTAPAFSIAAASSVPAADCPQALTFVWSDALKYPDVTTLYVELTSTTYIMVKDRVVLG